MQSVGIKKIIEIYDRTIRAVRLMYYLFFSLLPPSHVSIGFIGRKLPMTSINPTL